ncbi:unnamed protein product [Urochloa humidicola]
MVIKVSMPCERSRSRAMALVAKADGVISMEIAGDKLEVVGDGVDAVCLVSCLRRKLGHAEILQVEVVVKDNKPMDNNKDEPPVHPHAVEPLPQCYPGYYYPPPLVVCVGPTSSCHIM